MAIYLFDLWGTLVEQGTWSPIKQARSILNVRIKYSDFVSRMQKILMIKKFESLADAFTELCEEFSVKPTKETVEQLVGMWNKYWMLAKPYKEVEKVLKKLKKEGNDLVLVVNTDSFSAPNLIKKHKFFEMFDQMFFSYKMGIVKTNPLFLEQVLKKLNKDPKDLILVGDSLKSDISPGLRLGIKSILVDRKNSRDYELKIENLAELEKIL